MREYARNDYIPYGASAISTMASVFKQHRFRAGAPLSRFNLPNHKLHCHGNYCNDDNMIIIIVNLQLVQHSASYHIAVYVISVCTCTYTGMW